MNLSCRKNSLFYFFSKNIFFWTKRYGRRSLFLHQGAFLVLFSFCLIALWEFFFCVFENSCLENVECFSLPFSHTFIFSFCFPDLGISDNLIFCVCVLHYFFDIPSVWINMSMFLHCN